MSHILNEPRRSNVFKLRGANDAWRADAWGQIPWPAALMDRPSGSDAVQLADRRTDIVHGSAARWLTPDTSTTDNADALSAGAIPTRDALQLAA